MERDRLARDRPVTVEIVSPVPIERLATADAATWLDRRVAGEDTLAIRAAGFGREVRQAEVRRGQWLVEQGLADERDGAVQLRSGALAALRRRELLRVAGQLSDELGLTFAESKPGERIEGRLRRQVETLGGKLALIEKSREFTLVPWRTALERQIGRPVSGIVRSGGVSWSFGRERGGPAL